MVIEETKIIANNIKDFIDVPDGINRLRIAVLKLAVSGKLVSQDPKEGTAEGLYQRIQDERSKESVKSGKKLKSLPSIADEKNLSEIPESWKLVRLGEVSEFVYGSGLDKSDRKDNGKYIAYGANGPKTKTDLFNCEVDGLIIGRKGSAGAINKVEGPFYATDVTYYIPRNQFGSFEFSFLETLLQSMNLPSFAKGIKPGLNRNEVYSQLIGLPPLAEQKRIVEKADELMKIIDDLEIKKKERDAVRSSLAVSAFLSLGTNDSSIAIEHMSELVRDLNDVKELEKGILSLAVSGKLAPQDLKEGTAEDLYQKIQEEREKEAKKSGKKLKPLTPIMDDEIPFEIPDSWKWVRLSQLGNISTGKTPRTSHEEFYGGSTDFIGPGQIKNGNITPSPKSITDLGANETVVAIPGDILMVCIGGTIGKTAIVLTPIAFNQQINKITPFFVDSTFLYSVLSSGYFQKVIWDKASGAATPIVNSTRWSNILIPLPPLAEQKRIVEKVDELMTLTKKLKSTLNNE